jgi:cellulose 1,4-beta-cellobiosidase
VDNPYSGATFYVNPEWAQKANAEPNGSKISGVSTAVWLDSISAIAGSSSRMGLSQHLDAALAQKGSGPIVIEIVIYDLPGRDCAALASNGELGETDLPKYETQYIDPIVSILNASKYAPLRISAIIEPDSLPNLVTNASGQATATQECTDMKNNGNYEAGVEYAISKLHNVVNNNVYNYIDAAHHGWLGWSSNFGPAATELSNVVKASVGGTANIDGFITNTANTSALVEPFFTATTTVGGQQVRNVATWIDFNDYVDEMGFATAFRSQLISDGMPSTIGMLIDTSRNGWGNCVATTAAPCAADGPNRPTAASTSTDPNTFVNQSRVDRRIHAGNWCNQSGAGVGERPKASPASGIDAYVWIKPPGESDGSSVAIVNTQGKGFDRMCDPTYTGNARNGNSMTGALPGAPLSGDWFSVQFQQLVADAFPAL